jgi:hypothetical protein
VDLVTYQHSMSVLTRRSVDRMLLLTPRGGDELVELKGTGLMLWEMLETPLDEAGIAERLARTFDVDAELVRRDIAPVLDDLVARGALERVGPR